MSVLRPVNVSFQLDSNKIIMFPLLHSPKKRAVQSTGSEQYGYAADISFLTLYVKEILAISTPAITYSKLDKYPDWVQGITSLKSSVLIWNDTVLPAITALPENMQIGFEDIQDEFNEVNDKAGSVIAALRGSEDCKKYIEKFNRHLDLLKQNTDKEQQKLSNFFAMLIKHQSRLKEENKKMTDLSNQVSRLTEAQQSQIDQIVREMEGYQESRKAYIAGACVTGVLAGAAIASGTATIVLIPGVGICIGIAAFFSAGILGTGTAICSVQAEKLKKLIEELGKNKDNIDTEKCAVALIGNQFESLTAQTDDLVKAVQDIIKNWDAVDQALSNIQKAVKDLTGKPETEATLEIWEAVQNDLSSLNTIVGSLKEGIQTMDTKTKIYTDCDLSDCKTEEEKLKKLEEFVKNEEAKTKAS